MARSPRAKRRGSVRSVRRSRNPMGWYVLSALILVGGVLLVVVSRNPESASGSPEVGSHWHAAFGVDVCGTFLPDQETFENAEGFHTHADGLLHIHPFLTRASGENTTMGLYFDLAGVSADRDSFTMWDGQAHKTGDECDGKRAEVRWSLNGEEQDGDISDYHPQDQDRITLALLPADDEIPEPPSVATLASPSDVEPGSVTTTGGVLTVPGDTSLTVPGDTTVTTAAPDTETTTAGGTTASSSP